MVVGISKVKIYVVDAMSMKDKRMVLRSIKDRLKSNTNIAIAQVDGNDDWRIAELGLVALSNSRSHADKLLSNMIQFLEKDGRIQIVDYYTETMPIGFMDGDRWE